MSKKESDEQPKTKQKLRALKDSIIFTFLEEVAGGTFANERTHSGIYVPRTMESTANKPRWAVALSVGPECLDVKDGDFILVENLRWTTHVEVDGMKVWRTVEKDIIGISDEPPTPEY